MTDTSNETSPQNPAQGHEPTRTKPDSQARLSDRREHNLEGFDNALARARDHYEAETMAEETA